MLGDFNIKNRPCHSGKDPIADGPTGPDEDSITPTTSGQLTMVTGYTCSLSICSELGTADCSLLGGSGFTIGSLFSSSFSASKSFSFLLLGCL